MAEKFLTFRRFIDPNAANDFVAFLNEHNIPYVVEDASPTFDVTFANNTFEKEIHIKLKPGDFERTEDLLIEKNDVATIEIPEGYYLLEFSNEELYEILMKPDEWSALDYNLSQKILLERGKQIDADFLKTLRKKRKEELSEPEKSQKNWIYVGYFFALIGGLLGIFIGWHLMTFKKTLPDGTRANGYVVSDRKNGRNILVIGLLVFTLLSWIRWSG